MAGPHPTPVETPRAIVLGEVIAALNKADGNGHRLRTTSVTAYREAITKALTPISARTAEPDTLSVTGEGDGGNVVNMWQNMQGRA